MAVQRLAALRKFLGDAGWGEARAVHVNGDASTRSYTRLTREKGAGVDGGDETAILMDWPQAPDGPPIRDGRPYSQIAHLAEGTRSFVAVAGALLEAGLAAPRIMAADYAHGFLLLEDFGDTVFTGLAAEAENMSAYYRQAVDALLVLRTNPPALELRADGLAHTLPLYDREALHIETELLIDWLLPAIRGGEVSPQVRAEFKKNWDEQFDWLLAQPMGWVLRDYHSPNLMWREGESGLQRLGLIDFQDAVRGHLAYDLVSLLQDARLDLQETIEPTLLTYYCEAAASADPAFNRDDFLRAYRLLGAQRNTKILGIFARLARRDGKRGYIQHMPRIARYLAGNLAAPSLTGLSAWYERELPGDAATLTSRI
jgi:aminoglycoside/choline kinase family phosphotransferase